MIRLTERLPPRCLSPRVRSGRIRLEAVITSIFQNDLHPMTSSDILNARQCFLVQVSEDAVQQGLRSNCTESGEGWRWGAEGWRSWKKQVKAAMFESILHAAGHARLP